MSYSRGSNVLGTGYDEVNILAQRMRQGYAGFGMTLPEVRALKSRIRSRYAGLGDYASDHAAWLAQKAAYDKAYAAWLATTQQLKTAYALAQSHYSIDLIRWNNELKAYNAALVNYQNAQRAIAMGYSSNQAAVQQQFPGVVFPAGYPGCVSQAQHNAWQATCDQITSVKGLGALPTGPECALAMLSVCQPGPAAPAPPRPKPQPPAPPSYPAAPPSIGPEPQPPANVPTPPPIQTSIPTPAPGTPETPSVLVPTYQSTVPSTTPPPTTQASTKSGGLLSNGLLLIVLAGGGYALYRTLKKPKAAA
jgi:hypothetical protein